MKTSTPSVVSCAVALLTACSSHAFADDSPDLADLDFRQIIRSAKAKVFPAVVYIRCIRQDHSGGKKAALQVSGSGVIIRKTGEFLTNWHVVEKATEVRCLLSDGRAYDAVILGSDKDTDLAVGRLIRDKKNTEPFPFATLGDSSLLTEGDFVMAMGAPWGMSRSVSIGIVSCARRYLPGTSEYSMWLQTDAAISPGNSGGPLVNTDGEVIGLNTRGAILGGDMGFAIPSNTIRIIAERIIEHGGVNWSWTGFQLQPLRDFNRNVYFDGSKGVVVAGTDPESPARRAGFLPEDRLLSIGGRKVTATTEEDLPEIRRLLGMLPLNEPTKVTFLRRAKQRELELTPREKGRVEGEELDCPRWDFTAKDINQFDNPDLYFHRKKGVFVYGVERPGNAAKSGLQSQDILLKIGGTKTHSIDDVKKLHEESIANVGAEHRILVTVLRNGLMRQVVLDFSRDYERE